MAPEKEHKVYFNTPQRLTQLIGATPTVIVGGRRTGGIVVPTFKHGLTNTLPGLFATRKALGSKGQVRLTLGIVLSCG